MIPSGYAEDKVYSAVPTDGNGDLSFTRASNGTRINSAGLVEVCPWNLCTYSEELNIWTTERASVTTNATTAPNGTTTADKVITDSTANTTHQIYIGPFTTQNLPMVISCYAKKSEYNYIHLGAGGASTKTWFNLNDGTVRTQSSDVLSASIENVGNGWYRCINVINNTITSNYVEFGPASVDGSRVISGTPSGGIFAWGAQLNIGSTAKPYFPTTDRLNVPRLTYQNGGGGCPSLLLEKQSTNLIEYSNCISAFAFAGTFTASATTSPEGVSNAFSFLVNAGQNGGLSFITLTTSAQSYTFSAYLKGSVNGQKVKLYGDLNGTIEEFTLTTDWVRYTKTFTGSVGAQSLYLLNGSYFTPSQNNLYYGYGFQLEVSSYATSLIPSNGASATRVADACSKTGISSLIGQTEGTIFIDVENNETEGACIISTNAGTGSGSHIYIGQNNNNLALYIRDSFTYSVLESNIANIIGRKKIALAYGASFARIYMNGTQIYNSTSAVIPSGLDRIEMNNFVSTDIGSVKFNEVVYFQTKLTNSELASLTIL